MESFHTSFNEDFCVYLEFYLTGLFPYVEDEELCTFWCDGVASSLYYKPEDNQEYLSYKNVSQRKEIVTEAWMGTTGQDQYEMTIRLGPKALKNYKNEKSLIDCLPSEEDTSWIDIDPENRTIMLRLL